MAPAALDPATVRRMVEQVELVSHLAETIVASAHVEQPAIDSYLAAIDSAYHEAQALRSSNPVPDPATLRALADDAMHAYEQARTLSQSRTTLDLRPVEAMVVQARQVYEEVQRFMQSGRLPSPGIREEILRRHLDLLDELDAEYGPPSDRDVHEARRALDELRSRQ